MTIQATDIAILLVSFAACVYCFVLNRRLKALQNTKDGLGAMIVAMSKSISAMTSSTKETRSQVGEMAARLATQLEDAKQTCARLEALQASLEATQKDTVEQVTASQAELSTMMRIILDQSKTRVMEMNRVMNQLRELTEQTDEDYRPLERSKG
jgi:methyl-accepting chemotaxis protein